LSVESHATLELSPITAAPPSSFLEEIIRSTPGDSRLEMCIQCGTCGGSCPSGADMDHTPRQLFAMINADMRQEVLRSNSPWYCVSCYYCMVRCPQEIHVTDVMYTLKRKAIEAGEYLESSAADAPEFSETFIDYVENFGRSFELGVAARYHLRHHPLDAIRMASTMGLEMLRKGRMELAPTRIKDMQQLRRILTRAKELGDEL
jgi:heterodisulfide reductase subunit C